MRILAVAPHYDDVPLSIGQSLIDGLLADHQVTIGVVFGRSDWTKWFHPSRRRWPIVSAWRRVEEEVTARRFGATVRTARREEAVLRLGTTATDEYVNPDLKWAESSDYEPVVRLLTAWASDVDAVIAPAGVGGHLDHLITAAATVELARTGVPCGFYADRPYVSFDPPPPLEALPHWALRDEHEPMERVDLSGPVTPDKHRRMWYPSQFDQLFLDAQAADLANGAVEYLWATQELAGRLRQGGVAQRHR